MNLSPIILARPCLRQRGALWASGMMMAKTIRAPPPLQRQAALPAISCRAAVSLISCRFLSFHKTQEEDDDRTAIRATSTTSVPVDRFEPSAKKNGIMSKGASCGGLIRRAKRATDNEREFRIRSPLLGSLVKLPHCHISHITEKTGADLEDVVDQDEDEMEQEDMFVEPHESFEFQHVLEWGGPRRGGRLPEPTRYGDWERKGRCTDF